nr:unnamed protein product [Digitaria exilis]
MKLPHPPLGEEEPSPPPQRRPRGFASGPAAPPARRRGEREREREREREKERTKLRERHRRAITSRMLAGLRQHGNFSLPARADMNDVLAALARAAGWTVHPDGTTFRSSNQPPLPPPPPPQLGMSQVASVETPAFIDTLNSYAIGTPLDSQASALQTDDSLSPSSLDSVVAERSIKTENYANSSSMGIINRHCQLVDPEGVRAELRHLKSLNVDGVIVDCWWGIVEAWNPLKYEWSGYRDLFGIIKEFKLKVQVYFDFMRSFQMEFRNLSEEGLISAIEIGLGASGELRYPSFPETMGWKYPGIGEFQVLSLATLAFDGAEIVVKV